MGSGLARVGVMLGQVGHPDPLRCSFLTLSRGLLETVSDPKTSNPPLNSPTSAPTVLTIQQTYTNTLSHRNLRSKDAKFQTSHTNSSLPEIHDPILLFRDPIFMDVSSASPKGASERPPHRDCSKFLILDNLC